MNTPPSESATRNDSATGSYHSVTDLADELDEDEERPTVLVAPKIERSSLSDSSTRVASKVARMSLWRLLRVPADVKIPTA